MLAAEPPTEPTKPFPAPVEEDDDMVARTMSVNTYAKRWRLKSASRALPALAPFVPRMLKEDLASVTPHYPSIRHMAAAQRARNSEPAPLIPVRITSLSALMMSEWMTVPLSLTNMVLAHTMGLFLSDSPLQDRVARLQMIHESDAPLMKGTCLLDGKLPCVYKRSYRLHPVHQQQLDLRITHPPLSAGLT